jgi:hypothetical protein
MSLVVGQRVCDKDGYCATVRYVGPVATSKAATTVYAGCEWDDATRGKGDGAVVTAEGAEVRYFACDAGRASFLKVDLLNPGRGLLAALREKYCDDGGGGGGGAGGTTVEAGEVGTGRGAVPILLVGEEKAREQQQLSKLTSVVLQRAAIATVETDATSLAGATVGSAAPRLREVDLRDNLLWRWEEVAALGRQCAALHTLYLNGNRCVQGNGNRGRAPRSTVA